MIKKEKINGYTLAEVLITIAVIGALAVILLAVLRNTNPNRDRVMYLKTYMKLTTIISKFSNDANIYPETNGNDNYNYSDYPLANLFVNSNERYARNWGLSKNGDYNAKLCRLLADKGYHAALSRYTIQEINPSTSKTEDVLVNSCRNLKEIPDYSSDLVPSFSTGDGMDFYVYTQRILNSNESNGSYRTTVYVDTNGRDRGNNCMFSYIQNRANNCTEPDVHEFIISADGKIYPIDAMGRFYIQNKQSANRRRYTDNELQEIANIAPTNDDINRYTNIRLGVTANADADGNANEGNVYEELPQQVNPYD